MPSIKIDDDADAYIRENRRRQARWERISNFFKVVGTLIGLGAFFGISTYIGCNGCETPNNEALEAIQSQGLTQPKLEGHNWGACHESETSRRFTALNAQGRPVSGTVCCGQFTKGCTIRW
jgi:hypothetical protein